LSIIFLAFSLKLGLVSAGSILVGSNLVLNLSVSDLNVFPISSTSAPVNVPVGTVLGPSEKFPIGASLIVSEDAVPSKSRPLLYSYSFLAVSNCFCALLRDISYAFLLTSVA
jgi:hypothetical protein